jgi:uncharacterized protein (UPF0261 family)
VIDGGILGEPLFQPDITREQVAAAAGKSLKELLALGEAAKPIEVMAKGCSEIAEGLYAEGKLDGIIAIGGILGTTLGIAAMQRLPLWLPKLMVSAIGLSPFSPLLDPELGVKDLTVMPTVADFCGIDNITKTILQNASGAIAGMVETHEKTGPSQRPLIDIITFGTVVCKQALWAKPLLEQKGYDVMVFEAPENASEELVDQGLMRGTLDFVAGYMFINELCGGAYSPGPMRFEARIKRGIPQVFAPGVGGVITWSEALGPLPQRFANREIYRHGAMSICIRASEEEMAAAGVMMAHKLNEMTGPTAMLIPTRGFSEWDKQGHMWYNPEGRKAFIEGLKKHIGSKVKVVELDMHINDREFAEQAVTIFDEMMRGKFRS